MSLTEMIYKSCAFFGHRKIEVTEDLKEKVNCIVTDLIIKENVSEFLFGNRSDFDFLCYEIVTKLKTTYPYIRRVVYTCKNETCTLECEREEKERIYSSVLKLKVTLRGMEEERQHKTKWQSGKASYVERNYVMIDDSDFCVFYYDKNYKPPIQKRSKTSISYYQPNSGTALAYAYAKYKKSHNQFAREIS